MAAASRTVWSFDSLLLTCFLLVISSIIIVDAEISDNRTIGRALKAYRLPKDRQGREASSAAYMSNDNEKDLDIIATYSDVSGTIRTCRVKTKDLSASWVLENPINVDKVQVLKLKDTYQTSTPFQENVEQSTDDQQFQEGEILSHRQTYWSPVKFKRQILRQKRRDLRTAELVRQDKEVDKEMQATEAIESLKNMDTVVKGKYSIWRKDFENPNADSTLKLMRDQIIMAEGYANIALSKKQTVLYNSLLKQIMESLNVIGEANSDPSSLDRAKEMGHALSVAKDELYDCCTVERKLRAMLLTTEDNLESQKKRSAFLIQLAAKTVPKPLHCLSLQLSADYYFHGYYQTKQEPYNEKLEDPSLYHYAIFFDNVLATSVVVNSTVFIGTHPLFEKSKRVGTESRK
ncbi:hypothetical protein ES332_D01G014500v1 [Gossypium tomentosum]|uniref:Hexosyltransferase n=1 Tax=Gossypium tomentosum TaxID=34277 RepID=A0A5D2M457_GOSTO|nr:hypothetical protein ES332_D01G014500v1 [Gossypium tomentosum]